MFFKLLFGQQINRGKNNVEVYKTYTQKVLGKILAIMLNLKIMEQRVLTGLNGLPIFIIILVIIKETEKVVGSRIILFQL